MGVCKPETLGTDVIPFAIDSGVKNARTSRTSDQLVLYQLSYRPIERTGLDSNQQPLGYQPNVCTLLLLGAGMFSCALSRKRPGDGW